MAEQEELRGLAQNASRGLADDRDVPRHCRRLFRRRGQHQGVRARLWRGTVCRTRMRRVCAEGRATGDAGHSRPAALPVLRGHSVRQRLVPRAHEPLGIAGQPRGTLRSDRGGGGHAGDPSHGRRRPARIARDVRGRLDKYPTLQAVLDALGSQNAAIGYSLVVPAWRRRTNPLHVRLSRDFQTDDCRSSGSIDEAGRGPCAQRGLHRQTLRRSSAEPAGGRPGSGDPQRRAEPRTRSDYCPRGGRFTPARRNRFCGDDAERATWLAKRVRRSRWIERRSTTSVSSPRRVASWECPSAR